MQFWERGERLTARSRLGYPLWFPPDGSPRYSFPNHCRSRPQTCVGNRGNWPNLQKKTTSVVRMLSTPAVPRTEQYPPNNPNQSAFRQNGQSRAYRSQTDCERYRVTLALSRFAEAWPVGEYVKGQPEKTSQRGGNSRSSLGQAGQSTYK
jgi:hypothetical protein